MIFNENLIPPKYRQNKKFRDLSILLISILYHNIDIRSTLIRKSGTAGLSISLDFHEDVIGDMQDVVLALKEHDVIVPSYDDSELTRWKLVRPYFVNQLNDLDLEEDFVNKIRSYFGKRYLGVSDRSAPEQIVRLNLKVWMENNPDKKLTTEVFKSFVDERKSNNPEYVPNILRFIDNENKYPTKNLLMYLEEYDPRRRKQNFI